MKLLVSPLSTLDHLAGKSTTGKSVDEQNEHTRLTLSLKKK